ncbi:caspase-3-like [Pelodytes ibericus]
MDNPEKNTCLILNLKYFSNPELPVRHGTEKDCKALKKTFKGLGFQVRIERNLTFAEIKTVMEKVAAEDHSGRSCFVCAVLSHGNEHGINSTDYPFTLKWLAQFICRQNCKSLAGKPKLFFIQACRGKNYDWGIETDSGSGDEEDPAFIFPADEDFLYFYATPPGYFAWRNTGQGSWFIQALCKILQEHGGKLEILQILTRVICMVALEYESSRGAKEIPYLVSGLTKQLYLPPYEK